MTWSAGGVRKKKIKLEIKTFDVLKTVKKDQLPLNCQKMN